LWAENRRFAKKKKQGRKPTRGAAKPTQHNPRSKSEEKTGRHDPFAEEEDFGESRPRVIFLSVSLRSSFADSGAKEETKERRDERNPGVANFGFLYDSVSQGEEEGRSHLCDVNAHAAIFAVPYPQEVAFLFFLSVQGVPVRLFSSAFCLGSSPPRRSNSCRT